MYVYANNSRISIVGPLDTKDLHNPGPYTLNTVAKNDSSVLPQLP